MIQHSHTGVYIQIKQYLENIHAPSFLWSSASRSQDTEAAKMSPGVMKKKKKRMWYTYSRECYSAIPKYEIMPFSAAKKDLAMMIVREIIQTEESNII